MSTSGNSSIEKQKSEISEGCNEVHLADSCVIGNGIIALSDQERDGLVSIFENWSGKTSFFIPASGSGSRMFSDIIDFVATKEESKDVSEFFKKLPELALFQAFPLVVREKVKDLQSIYLAEYLVSSEGMAFQEKPKGLIPFHIVDGRVLNPFQEQFIQALEILKENGKIHFTVQKEFEEEILKSLKGLGLREVDERVSFSYQDPSTDAYCFDEKGELVIFNEQPLRRPAGHGALLKNLNHIDADLVLIKNIDNVQHSTKAALNELIWKQCAGLLLKFKQDMFNLLEDFDADKLKAFNEKYQLLSNSELEGCTKEMLKELAGRPSRVCGMVENEGAPGGGPFWVKDGEVISKQIVEKVQISEKDRPIVEQSSHFNPVFIALSKTDSFGKALDLNEFVDPSKYLVVKKPFNGSTISYRELPGLWNGSMHYWNTVFVEIPKEVFSPVKTVFDLLKDAHHQ